MAFEEITAHIITLLFYAVVLLPAVWIIDVIRQRIEIKTGFKKLIVLFGVSFLFTLSLYPFAIPEEFLPFGSAFATYVLVLLFISAIYLVIFNKTK